MMDFKKADQLSTALCIHSKARGFMILSIMDGFERRLDWN